MIIAIKFKKYFLKYSLGYTIIFYLFQIKVKNPSSLKRTRILIYKLLNTIHFFILTSLTNLYFISAS